MPELDRRALDRAARMWGIESEYWDIWGQRHETDEAVERAVLAALGVDATNPEDVHQALEERAWREWSSPLPPVLVVTQAEASHIPVNVPEDASLEATWELTLAREDGESSRVPFVPSRLAAAASEEVRGVRFRRVRVPIPPLPLGYHRAEVALGSRRSALTLIVTPERAYLPPALEEGGKAAGIAFSLWGVRSARNWGCGDYTDLLGLADWVAGHTGADFLALNPLHAIENRQPYNTSPYLPTTAFFRNPLYLDIERTPEFAASPAAQSLLASPAVQEEIAALRASEFVEYERVWALKRRFLKLLYRRFRRTLGEGGARARAFRDYQEREGDFLTRYATWCALWEWLHRRDRNVWIWPEWPAEYRDPDSPAVDEFRRRQHWRVEFFAYLQWLVDEQLAAAQARTRERGMAIGLYHDLALATDRCGADLWAYRPFYAAGCRVGAPPDDFSPNGQDWSFPPPHTVRIREDGYRLFIESIRANTRHGGALRIDHVMRFFRLWWIPDGFDATRGAYVRDYHEDLLKILALESVRQQVAVVGEDLGTVTDALREELARRRILSYKVLYFEKDNGGRFRAPAEYARQALVSSTTHDLPTLAGYWTGNDIEARLRAGLLPAGGSYERQKADRERDKQRLLDALHQERLLPDWFPRSARDVPELTGEMHYAVCGFLAATPSLLFVLNQEDLTKETEQQNLPGSTHQYPNWRRKMRYTLEELVSRDRVRDFSAMFRDWLERAGRRNQAR